MAEVAAETKVQSKVIVAIDESECSSYALKWALQNLDDKLKSGLLLFSVISIDYSGAFAGGYGSLPADLMTSMQDNQKKFVASLLAKAKEICAKHGVTYICRLMLIQCLLWAIQKMQYAMQCRNIIVNCLFWAAMVGGL
ncbi:uncharacterized protein LOC104896434 isoform X2 [Beta vulgaris subsp. vulgaris]|uniref:uncharacterized protein LOC104896434 isoform X2 n=1 Tax=Beta vulgaris subsp. vulgaris TaxID=3555 RepID=UPI00203675C4|nr:uncharacterized protein LOC104896434 isoform X2 [Beta vulgaris subsp. vulgaris]